MGKRDKFEQAVQELTPHNRNGRPICQAAALGRIAGMSSQEVFDFIMANAPGEDRRPDPKMVADAIKYAERIPINDESPYHRQFTFRRSPSAAERWEEQRCLLPMASRNFVENIIQKTSGTTVAFIASLSERPIPGARKNQAAAQLDALGGRSDSLVWAGWIDKNVSPRKRPIDYSSNGIISYQELSKQILADATIPSHISLNPQTGHSVITTNGRPSWDCLKTISTCRYALLEFDDLPFQQQLDFLAGLIQWNRQAAVALNIRSAVWSGSKSIHIILELPSRTPMQTDSAVCEDDIRFYAKQFKSLMRIMASSDDPSCRIDISNAFTGGRAATHTRLAGAMHPTTRQYASLLYLGK